MKFSIKETADLVTFTEEIFNGKLPFFVQCKSGHDIIFHLDFQGFYHCSLLKRLLGFIMSTVIETYVMLFNIWYHL